MAGLCVYSIAIGERRRHEPFVYIFQYCLFVRLLSSSNYGMHKVRFPIVLLQWCCCCCCCCCGIKTDDENEQYSNFFFFFFYYPNLFERILVSCRAVPRVGPVLRALYIYIYLYNEIRVRRIIIYNELYACYYIHCVVLVRLIPTLWSFVQLLRYVDFDN